MSNHLLPSFDERQRKPEGGALSKGTFHPDLSLMLCDEHLTDVQPQAQPFPWATLYRHSLDLVKALPQFLLRFFRETRSPISYPDTGHGVLDHQPDMNRLIGTRIAQRIGDIVGHHLADAIPISEHVDRSVLRQFEQERAFGSGYPQVFDGLAHDVVQVTAIQ